MNVEISFDERKKIQLEMLDEVDAFCRANGIRYSIAFGTLLGAVRHKGFIPWDDDVDIMMPLPDLKKFKESFQSENIEYVDVDTNSRFEFEFSRLAYKPTYCRKGIVLKTYGICIDLYVMIGIPKDSTSFFNNFVPLSKMRRQTLTIWRASIRRLPIKTIPFFSLIQRKCRDYLFEKSEEYNKAKSYYIIAGPLSIKEKMIYDRDLFASTIKIQFEDRNYMAIADWDYFLRLRYGNYMELPPEDQRVPYHGGKYYWKK